MPSFKGNVSMSNSAAQITFVADSPDRPRGGSVALALACVSSPGPSTPNSSLVSSVAGTNLRLCPPSLFSKYLDCIIVCAFEILAVFSVGPQQIEAHVCETH